jgi:hypothetical protein
MPTGTGGFTPRWISPATALILENTRRRGIATLHELVGEGN